MLNRLPLLIHSIDDYEQEVKAGKRILAGSEENNNAVMKGLFSRQNTYTELLISCSHFSANTFLCHSGKLIKTGKWIKTFCGLFCVF